MNAKNSKKQHVETYGGWHFARDFSAGFFGLVNSGRVFPAFGLLLLVIMGLIVWRLPEAELAPVIKNFFDLLRGSVSLAIVLLLLTNFGWFFLLRRQKTIYENEIKRLSDIRKDLLHLGSSQVLIENHRTSTGAQSETYLFPESKLGEQKGQI